MNNDGSQKIACLLVPHFPVRLEMKGAPELRGKPVILTQRVPGGQIVLDASEEAGDVTCGMPALAALSRCPHASMVTAYPPRYQEGWGDILDLLERVSPGVEDGGLGCAYMDIEGLSGLHGGEDRLASAVLSVLPGECGACIGMASSKFTAHMAAATSAPGRYFCVPEDASAYLASFSVDMLPLPYKAIASFHGFGLHKLRDIARLPLNAVEAQFGARGKLAWELANGIDLRPLVPRKPQIVVKERVCFLEPTTTREALLVAVESLLARAFSRKELQGRCARLAIIEAELSTAAPFTRRVTFKEPVATGEQAFSILKNLLADVGLPGPIEALSLTLSGIGGEAGRQISLFTSVRRRTNLAEAIRELQTRFAGKAPIYRIREVEPWSRIPERRRVLVPYDP
ncbi:MAG: DNA polymerase Y family protein [Chloroflexota bacterium]